MFIHTRMNSDFKIITIQIDKIVLTFIKYINYRVGGYTYIPTTNAGHWA